MKSDSPADTSALASVELAEITEIIAKQKLYENLALYCRGQDRKDLELMKSTFWPEATDNHGMFNGSAYEFCEWAVENHKSSQHKSHHYITNVLIEIEEDLARREGAFVYVMVMPDGQQTRVNGGRYRDLCERRGGEWKVLRRVVIHDHAAEFESSAEMKALFGSFADTARFGDIYPRDAIYDPAW